MLVSWEGEVGMDLVTDDQHIVALANLCYALQHLLAPHRAGRVVWVAHYEDLAAVGLAFKIVEINSKATIL